MHAQTLYVLVAILLLVLIFTTMLSCGSFEPSQEDSVAKNAASTEGFAGRMLKYFNKDETNDFHGAYSMGTNEQDCKRIYGFDGLFCAPGVADKSLDLYATAEGKLDCEGSGLTNSRGSLCLDENQKNMLRTRGGNNTGRDAEIGH